MAHHNSTPASVLSAPVLTPTFVELNGVSTEFKGVNRAQRRANSVVNPRSYMRFLPIRLTLGR